MNLVNLRTMRMKTKIKTRANTQEDGDAVGFDDPVVDAHAAENEVEVAADTRSSDSPCKPSGTHTPSQPLLLTLQRPPGASQTPVPTDALNAAKAAHSMRTRFPNQLDSLPTNLIVEASWILPGFLWAGMMTRRDELTDTRVTPLHGRQTVRKISRGRVRARQESRMGNWCEGEGQAE